MNNCLPQGASTLHFPETILMPALPEETRYRLLRSLESNPDASQRELAEAMGVSLGKLNYCLKALVANGWVKAGSFSRNPEKKRYAYLLTPQGIEAKTRLTVQFLQAKMREYDALRREIETLRQEAALPGAPVGWEET